MRGNAHVRFGGRAGETHITRVAQGAPVRPYYVKAGLEKQKAALLVVIGAMSDGRKEILTIVPGYRESSESWTDVDLRDRGLAAPVLLAADGHLGIWTAVAEIWPQTTEQRCWNHRIPERAEQTPEKRAGRSAGTAHANPVRAHPSRSEETSRSIRQTLSTAVPRTPRRCSSAMGIAW